MEKKKLTDSRPMNTLNIEIFRVARSKVVKIGNCVMKIDNSSYSICLKLNHKRFEIYNNRRHFYRRKENDTEVKAKQ